MRIRDESGKTKLEKMMDRKNHQEANRVEKGIPIGSAKLSYYTVPKAVKTEWTINRMAMNDILALSRSACQITLSRAVSWFRISSFMFGIMSLIVYPLIFMTISIKACVSPALSRGIVRMVVRETASLIGCAVVVFCWVRCCRLRSPQHWATALMNDVPFDLVNEERKSRMVWRICLTL